MAERTIAGAAQTTPWRAIRWSITAALLLIPFVAMQVTAEVQWTGGDFAAFAAMLLLTGGGYEIVSRVRASAWYKAALGIAIATAFLLVWADLAVGLIGSPRNPINFAFAGVLGVGAARAALVRLRPIGTAQAMAAMVAAHAVIVLAAALDGARLRETLFAAAFALPWLGSAWLFRRAAR